MESELNQDQIIRILQTHGVHADAIQQVIIAKPSFTGENVCSLVFTVTAKLRDGQVLEMFAKTLVQNPKYRKDIQEMRLFQREATFYQQILPELETFVRKASGEQEEKYDLNILPKCYFGDENLILLENLNPKGYTMMNKFVKHDFLHASAVMDTMAKLHAPSYLLMKTVISPVDLLTKYPILTHLWSTQEGEKSIRPMVQSWIQTSISILKQNQCDDCEYSLQFLQTIKSNPHKAMMKNAKQGEFQSKFLSINHGDSWNNNILFKDRGNGQLHAMLIDFQLPNIGSLVLDISTYLFASVHLDVLVNGGWRKCLQVYYQRFNKYVRILGGTLDFTQEELEEEFKQRYLLGFLVGIAMIVALSAFDSIQNLDEMEGNFFQLLEEATQKWLRENPSETKNLSRHLVNLFRLHQEFFTI